MERREHYIADEAHATTSDAFYLTFSAEEVGQIAVLIIKGVARKEAILSMPRYSRGQHKAYSAFYDQLRAVITAGDTK